MVKLHESPKFDRFRGRVCECDLSTKPPTMLKVMQIASENNNQHFCRWLDGGAVVFFCFFPLFSFLLALYCACCTVFVQEGFVSNQQNDSVPVTILGQYSHGGVVLILIVRIRERNSTEIDARNHHKNINSLIILTDKSNWTLFTDGTTSLANDSHSQTTFFSLLLLVILSI